MTEQFIASGANTFLIIVAVLIGFVAATILVDIRSTSKEEASNE